MELPLISTLIKTPKVKKESGPVDFMKRNNTTAMVINSGNAIMSGVMGAIAMKSINDNKPVLLGNAPVLEAKKVEDTGAQQAAAGRESIIRSIDTARRDAIAGGSVGLSAAFAAKRFSMENELSGRIEGMRTSIDQINTQMENNINANNAQTRMNVAQMNANIINAFNQMKGQSQSQVLNSTMENISANVGGIGQVLMNTNLQAESKRLKMLEELKDMNLRYMDYSATNNVYAANMAKSRMDTMTKRYKGMYGVEPLFE